ncbi:MAG: hypothetical protein AAGC99_05485 [Pseudomonadota bacterium]
MPLVPPPDDDTTPEDDALDDEQNNKTDQNRDYFKNFYKKPTSGYSTDDLHDAARKDIAAESIGKSFQSLARELLTSPLPPFSIYCAEFDPLALTLAAGFFGSQPATVLELDKELATVAEESLDLTKLVHDCEAPTQRLVIDAHRCSNHVRFWEKISSAVDLQRFCSEHGYQIILRIGAEDLACANKWAAGQDWEAFRVAEPGFEEKFIIDVAVEQDDRLDQVANRQELARRVDRPDSTTLLDLLDALLKGEVPGFVDELEKDYEQGRAGQRERVFRRALLDPESKNPGQASALFVGAFFPGIKRSTFLQLNKFLHLVAMSVWKPQKRHETTGELEPWDPMPSDQDRNVVGVYFEAAADATILQSRLGGSAALRQYQDLFNRSAPDALTFFVDGGLVQYPVLADDDKGAHEALVELTAGILQGEFDKPLLVPDCRKKILDIALTHQPHKLNRAQGLALRKHAPLFLVDVTQRLSLGEEDGSQENEASAQGLKLLLADLLEVSRLCEIQNSRMEWLHDIIVRTTILSPNPMWNFVMGRLYDRQARLRQQWLVTNGLWRNISEALKGAPSRLNALVDACLEQLDLTKAPLPDQQFRLQLCSRLLILWLSSLSVALRQLREGDPEELETAKQFCEALSESQFIASGDVAAKARELSLAHQVLRQAEFQFIERTRGSDIDRDVLEGMRHLASEQNVQTTSVVILESLMPIPTKPDERKAFLNAFEQLYIDAQGNGPGLSKIKPAPAVAYELTSDTSRKMQAPPQKTPYEEREEFWLSCLPLALIFVERAAGGDKRMLIDGLRRAAKPKAAAGLLHKQIGDLKHDFKCAANAAKSLADVDLAKTVHKQMIERYRELDELRKDLVSFGKDLNET